MEKTRERGQHHLNPPPPSLPPVFFRREGRNVLKGVGAHRELHVLHSVAGVRGAAPVVEGVYVGASLAHAAALVARRLARPGQFKFFYSNSRWEPGQLEAEVAEVRLLRALQWCIGALVRRRNRAATVMQRCNSSSRWEPGQLVAEVHSVPRCAQWCDGEIEPQQRSRAAIATFACRSPSRVPLPRNAIVRRAH
jgi:hypothetical protein